MSCEAVWGFYFHTTSLGSKNRNGFFYPMWCLKHLYFLLSVVNFFEGMHTLPVTFAIYLHFKYTYGLENGNVDGVFFLLDVLKYTKKISPKIILGYYTVFIV